MKRTTVVLPEEVDQVLGREARRRATPVATLVREAITRYVGLDRSQPREIPFAAVGESGYTNTCERIDELVRAKLGSARDR